MMPTKARKQHKMTPSKPQPPCDVLIFHHHDDHTTAQHLQETVHTLAPSASCRLYTPQNVRSETDVFLFSVQVWLLVSECAIQDSLMMFYKDELIMKSIKSGRNQFIPVFTKPKNQYINLPHSLGSYKGLTLTDSHVNKVISRMLNSANHQRYKDQLTTEYSHQCSEWAKCEQLDNKEITDPSTENVVCPDDQTHDDNIKIREEPVRRRQRNIFNITINGNPKIHCQPGLNINTTEIQKEEERPGHHDKATHQHTTMTLLNSDSDDVEEGNKNEGQNENVNIEDLAEDVEAEAQRSSNACSGLARVYNVVINHPKVVNIGNYH